MSSHNQKREKFDPASSSSPSLPPRTASPDPEPTQSNPDRSVVPRPSRPFLAHFFSKFGGRPTKSNTISIHRCLLISEILSLILEFIRQFDESPECETKRDRTSGKRTLAALARTCRTLSGPALDVLWMRLDNLDPLIKVLPRRMWSKKNHPFIVRFFMGEKQWTTFRKYAERVRYLRGPCWRVSATVQNNVIDALARYPKATLPLLPNLNELAWSELKMSNLIDPSVSLIRYFAGPGVTTVSLFLICWPNHVSSELAVLANLPNLCPNVTSFTAFFPRSSYNDHSSEIGDIVKKWPQLHVLRSCALPQPVMDTVTSSESLDTLSIELNNSSTAHYTGQLPSHVHTLSLGGNSAALCIRYLETIQGSPSSFHLRVGADDSTTADIEELVGMLPTRLDKDRVQTLTIELTSSYWSTPASDSFLLSPALLHALESFPALKELDVSTFSAAELDDVGYGEWISRLRGLKSLKMGVGDVSKAEPKASIRAVLEILKACRQLETLWIVFDATLPWGEEKWPRKSSKELEFGMKNNATARKAKKKDENQDEHENEWGVTNQNITYLGVGYSPIGEDETSLEGLTRCLMTVMPRLEKIRADKYPAEVSDRWRKVQEKLMRG